MKKPPKNIWVNVYITVGYSGKGFSFYTSKIDATDMACSNSPDFVGTFKYVLEEKGKK